MKKVFILVMLIASFTYASAQKLDVNTEALPISKKARKFGQYGGSYWDANKENLQTIYTYRETKKSPRSYDLVKTSLSGKISGPETDLFNLNTLSKLDLEIDETISEEEEFENFNQEMVWIKRVDLGWNAVAFDGHFEAISDAFGFVGYKFDKESKKTLLMGEENQSLMLDFVLAEGPIVEKYSSKVLDQGFMGLSSFASFAFVPKGEKVVLGGLMSGRVKIGMDASPDWLNTRYLVGTYNTGSMQWEEQNFIEFDYTMHALTSLKTSDGVVVLLRKDTKGTIENNRVRFNDSEYRGVVMLEFDNKGHLKSKLVFDLDDFNFPPIGTSLSNTVAPKFDIKKVGDFYYVSAVSFGKGTQFESLNLYKIANGNIAFSKKFMANDLNDYDSPDGEKVKYLIKKREVPVIDEIIASQDEILFLGSIKEVGNFVIRLDSDSGDLKQLVASEHWIPKQAVNIPLGVRGWSKTKSSRNSEGFIDYPVTVKENGDWYYILYRKMNDGMTPGSSVKSTTATGNGYITTYVTTKVTIDEVFAFAKLILINKKTGAMVEPLVIDDEILVGAEGMYLAEDGTAFLHGYDGKKYQMTTAKIK